MHRDALSSDARMDGESTGDAELLRRYAEERSEAAFTELVRRHLNLVYFAALRQVGGDAHAAKDVAQAVFIDLARKAASLSRRPVLASWLHTSAHFAAAKARRARQRRDKYEQEAMNMPEFLHPSASTAEWDRLRPLIDEVIHELSETDREAVLSRFFEGRAFAQIGATLNVTEDAARMRVERALEKVRVALARRDVTSTSAALGAVLANQAIATAPAGLAASVTGAALSGAAGTTVGVALSAAVLGFMSATKTNVILAAAGVLAASFAVYESSQANVSERELAHARGEHAAQAARLGELTTTATGIERDLAARAIVLDEQRASAASRAATVAATAAEKAQQDQELNRFLANDPELKKLRFEANQARAKAQNFARMLAAGRSREEIEQYTQHWAQIAENGRMKEASRIGSAGNFGITGPYIGREALKTLSTFLFHEDEPFTAQQGKRLTDLISAAARPDEIDVRNNSPFACVDWDRVEREAAPMLSPKQIAGLQAMAAWGRNGAMAAAVKKQLAAPPTQ